MFVSVVSIVLLDVFGFQKIHTQFQDFRWEG